MKWPRRAANISSWCVTPEVGVGGSERHSLANIYGVCAYIGAWLKFCKDPVSVQFWDSVSKLCLITSWKAEPVTYSSVMGSISAGALGSPVIFHRCSARLFVPHLLAGGRCRCFIQSEGFITNVGVTWHGVGFNLALGSIDWLTLLTKWGWNDMEASHFVDPQKISQQLWYLLKAPLSLKLFCTAKCNACFKVITC